MPCGWLNILVVAAWGVMLLMPHGGVAAQQAEDSCYGPLVELEVHLPGNKTSDTGAGVSLYGKTKSQPYLIYGSLAVFGGIPSTNFTDHAEHVALAVPADACSPLAPLNGDGHGHALR